MCRRGPVRPSLGLLLVLDDAICLAPPAPTDAPFQRHRCAPHGPCRVLFLTSVVKASRARSLQLPKGVPGWLVSLVTAVLFQGRVDTVSELTLDARPFVLILIVSGSGWCGGLFQLWAPFSLLMVPFCCLLERQLGRVVCVLVPCYWVHRRSSRGHLALLVTRLEPVCLRPRRYLFGGPLKRGCGGAFGSFRG